MGMATKPKPKRKFATFLQVRISPPLHAQFLRSANAKGLSLSAWCRMVLIAASKDEGSRTHER